MSLLQATSPEEAKRELKQQVFLAIQGKYDTRQTSQLIEDIDTITDAIMGGDKTKNYGAAISQAIMDQPYNGKDVGFDTDTTKGKSFLFFAGDIDGESRQFNCDENGMPLAATAYPAGSNDTYYRHSLKVDIDGKGKTYYFYSLKSEYKILLTKSVADTLSKLVEFHNRDDYVPATTKPHIFIGGRHDGDTRQLTVDSEFKPHEESIGLSTTHSKYSATTIVYWRHQITVVTGGWSVTRWFYCNEKNIDSWTEQKLLSTLDRINKFFVDNKEDSMNSI